MSMARPFIMLRVLNLIFLLSCGPASIFGTSLTAFTVPISRSSSCRLSYDSRARTLRKQAQQRWKKIPMRYGDRFAATSHPFDPYDLGTDYIDPVESSTDASGDWSTISFSGLHTTTTELTSTDEAFLESHGDSTNIFDEAYLILEEHYGIHREEKNDTTINELPSIKVGSQEAGQTDVDDAIEMIVNCLDYVEDGIPLYDTDSTETNKKTLHKEAEEGDFDDDIALMIRCNQSPQGLLIAQGSSLPALTDEVKYSAQFLFERTTTNSVGALPLRPTMTSFFKDAVEKIFCLYSQGSAHAPQVMERHALSAWMTKCLSFQLGTTQRCLTAYRSHVGPYDKSINLVLSRYCLDHGSGHLNIDEFTNMYLEVAWVGYMNDARKKNDLILATERFHPVPSLDGSILVHGRKNTDSMLKDASLFIIWRDLEAHGFFSPAEEERVRLIRDIEKVNHSLGKSGSTAVSNIFMDECELFDAYEDRLSMRHSPDDVDHDIVPKNTLNVQGKREKSSHQRVEVTSDGFPLRIRDGQFVFIDEESCIGCSQCASIAPSSFKMIGDTGRARTFELSNTPDIEQAISSCPVNCMHMVSFDELKVLENARDEGDGRNDHRYLGRGTGHIPLHVAGRDSDANNKSSWYHFLKTRCDCPQRGCYDCPSFNKPGANPYFKKIHRDAEHRRALNFISSGIAQEWRKVEEL